MNRSKICNRAFHENNAFFLHFFQMWQISTFLTHPQQGQTSVQHSGIIRHNQPYSGNIQGYSGTFRGLYNSRIFKTLVYSELSYVHKPGTFRALVYTEPSDIQQQSHILNPAILRILNIEDIKRHDSVRHLRQRVLQNQYKFFFALFSNMTNCNLGGTTRNKMKLVFNISASSAMIKYIQELCRGIQAHPEVCVTGIQSKLWYIKKPGILRTLAYSKP